MEVAIYLIGYFFAYLLCKYVRNKSNQNNWSDVFLSIIISAGSWTTCVLLLFIIIIVTIVKWSDKHISKTDSKPPNFL